MVGERAVPQKYLLMHERNEARTQEGSENKKKQLRWKHQRENSNTEQPSNWEQERASKEVTQPTKLILWPLPTFTTLFVKQRPQKIYFHLVSYTLCPGSQPNSISISTTLLSMLWVVGKHLCRKGWKASICAWAEANDSINCTTPEPQSSCESHC